MYCYHCGREVKETTHTQKRYKVDYYLLHTGKTEWAYLANFKEDATAIRYLKLTHPIDIITCVQCHTRPAIRQCLDEDFLGGKSLLDSSQETNDATEIISKG